MKKFILALMLAGVITLSLTACGTNEASSTISSSSSTVKDSEGNEIAVPETIEKIVSTSPTNTEILAGLGLADKIVAADTYSFDAGVDASISTIDMMNVNIEEIVALKPDVVLINGMNMTGAQDPYASLKDAGITVLYIPSADSLQDIKDDITFISAYTKTSDKGAELVKSIDTAIAEVKAVGDTVTEKKKVYYEVSEAPYCYSFGKNTYLNEILELAGAENIFANQDGWLSVTEESVIDANPDIILSSVGYDGYDYKEILSRPGWDATNAVKSNAVFHVPTNPTSRASQNIAEGMKAIAKAIYPELYK